MNKIEENNLIKTIDDLAKEKAEKTKLEGSIKKASDFIKQKFRQLDIQEYTTDSFKAYLKYSNKVDLDECKVIKILKEYLSNDGQNKVIKTKEYVDFEALETLIYNGIIPAEILEPAQSVKTIISLHTKEVKKEKTND